MIRNKRNLLIAAGLLMSTASWGQEAASASFLDQNFQSIVLYLLIIILVIFIFGIMSIFRGLLNVMIDELPEEKQAKYANNILRTGFSWKSLNRSLTDAVPIEKEKDIMLDHDYDGIHELDNHLPPWWKWLFYITIAYAVVYLFIFVTTDKLDQIKIYDQKVAEAKVAKEAYLATLSNNVDETNVTLTTDPAILTSGKELFIKNCVVCHGELGEGKIGPNLTDEYWLHGGGIVDVFKTVKYGVANKMVAWESQLLPGQLSDVANYVLSLQGTNPPNPKEPQGEIYDAGAGDTEAAAEEVVDAVEEAIAAEEE